MRGFLIQNYMNKNFGKFFDSVCDIAVVVGSSVGVGLISGKETQVFIGSVPNALIFAVVFCVVMSVFREFCRKYAVTDTAALSKVCFGRYSTPFGFVFILCSFVCVVTCLAGVEQCLSDILYLSNLPLYAVCVATIAALVMMKGLPALKVCNVVSIVMAIALFVALAFCRDKSAPLDAVPRPYMPIVYALFSFTMCVAVTCKLGAKTDKIRNVALTAVSATIIAVLLVVVSFIADFSQPLPTLSAIGNPYLKCFAVITVALSSMCGIVGCALPVCELVDGVIGDKTVSSACVFMAACAFCMFGFDFLVKYGYVFIALIGAVVVVSASFRNQQNKVKRR